MWGSWASFNEVFLGMDLLVHELIDWLVHEPGGTKKHQKFLFEYWVVSQKSYLNMGHLKKNLYLHT